MRSTLPQKLSRWFRKARPARRAALRLAVETLEDRLTPSTLVSGYGQIPLSFEINQGQADPALNFVARGSGYGIGLTPTAALLNLAAGADVPATTVNMQLLGGNAAATAQGLDLLPGVSNYLVGSDPSQFHTNIATYGRVKYQDVYPGISVIYYGNQQQLEYDFVVAPGADPGAIRLRFDGAAGLSLDAEGNLLVHTAGGDLVEHAPILYQDGAAGRQAVSGGYILDGGNQVHFQVGAFDGSRPLVIDPVLSYSTYLGGIGNEGAAVLFLSDIAVDAAGNAYVTGQTGSADFPVTAGAAQTTFGGGVADAYVAKLNPAGSAFIYVTYLGGSGVEGGRGIALDGAGNAFVTGFTDSVNFPVTAGAAQTAPGASNDVFVAKLNAAGSALVYATYLGAGGIDNGSGIALDAAGNAYVAGMAGAGFPVTPGAAQIAFGGVSDVFVAKLNPAGSMFTYVTYLGGVSTDGGEGIAVDGSGNAYVAGNAGSGFPVTPGAAQIAFGGGSDVIVAKLNAAGSMFTYATYLGAAGFDRASGIAIDAAGNAFVAGNAATGFPVTVGAAQTTFGGSVTDAFVAELNAAGSALVYSTYLGGIGNDQGKRIALDPTGNAYVTGIATIGFPVTAGAVQTTSGGGTTDAFVARLNSSGSALVYSTFLGGGGNDQGTAITVDTAGNIYFSGFGAMTFPVTAGAAQTTFGGGTNDAFVAKIGLVADLAITKTDGVSSVLAGGSTTYTIVVSNTGPDDVLSIPVSDPVPAGAASASWTASATAGSSVAQASGSGAISTTVNLLSGGSVTFTLTVTLSPTATGTLVNTATVSVPVGVVDPNLANNSATDTDTITPAPPTPEPTPAPTPTPTPTPARVHLLAVGADAGGGPHVKVFDADTLALKFSFFAYDLGFSGGVRVAVGDVTGDGVPDIVTGAGPGGGPHVKVFDGTTAAEVRSFFAFDAGFTGGVFVAAGDVDGDGRADLIVGAGAGGGPHVKVFSGASGAEIRSFFAVAADFGGGVSVAAGDVSGDGRADIITGAGPGAGPHVKVFDGASGAEVSSFFAYATAFSGGVFVGAADLDGDGRAEVLTGPGVGGGQNVKAFNGVSGATLLDRMLLTPPQVAAGLLPMFGPEGPSGGLRVAGISSTATSAAKLLLFLGPGAPPILGAFDVTAGLAVTEVDRLFAFALEFLGGGFVGGG